MAEIEASGNEPSDRWLKLVYLANGGTLKESRGVTRKQMNVIYRVGYGHYYSSRYKEALIIFRYLSLLDHRCHAYLLGLGSTLKAMHEYDQAITVLDCAEQADKTDPRATLCKAECLIELKDVKSAAMLLRKAEGRISKDSQWSGLLQKIKRLKSFAGK